MATLSTASAAPAGFTGAEAPQPCITAAAAIDTTMATRDMIPPFFLRRISDERGWPIEPDGATTRVRRYEKRVVAGPLRGIPLAPEVSMNARHHHLTVAVLGTIAAALHVTPVLAQQSYQPPRTEYGYPDLQGIWTNATITPLV